MARLISVVFLFLSVALATGGGMCALASGGGMGAGGGGDKPGAHMQDAGGETQADAAGFAREDAERMARLDATDPHWRERFPKPKPTPVTYRGCYTTYYTFKAAQHDCPPGAIAVEYRAKQWTCECSNDTTSSGSGGG